MPDPVVSSAPRLVRRALRLAGPALASVALVVGSVYAVDLERGVARQALAQAQQLNLLERAVRLYEHDAEGAASSPASWSAQAPALDARLLELRRSATGGDLASRPDGSASLREVVAADERLDRLARSGGTEPAWPVALDQYGAATLRLRNVVGNEQARRIDLAQDELVRADTRARYTQAATLLFLLLFSFLLAVMDRRGQRRHLAVVRDSERRLQDVLDQSPTAVYLTDLDGRYTMVNRAWEAATGRRRAAVLGQPVEQVWPAGLATAGIERRRQVARTGQPVEAVVAGPVSAGRTFLESTFPLRDADGTTYGVGGVATDVTDQMRAQERERLLAAVVSNSADAILTLRDGVITSCNPAAEAMFGAVDDLAGQRLLDVLPGQAAAQLREVLDAGASRAVEQQQMRLVLSSGDVLLVAVTVTPLADQDGDTVSVLLQDIGAAERHRAELIRQARTDNLTGLPNRLALQERLAAATADGPARNGALLFVDVDHFKLVNDTFGHTVGDALLRTLSQRIADQLGPESFFARLGGDEFALLHLAELNAWTAVALADRVRQLVAEPLDLPEVGTLSVTASLGVCLTPAADGVTWLRDADIAMYAAKRAGRDRSVLFTPEEGLAAVAQQQLRHDLTRAVDDGELVLHYQPVVDLASGRPTGVEALVRWQHPERGLVQPDVFIPLAEDSGAIVGVGAFVWRESIRQLLEWDVDAPYPLHIAVNASIRQLHDEQFLTMVAEDFLRFPQLRGRVMVEITESALAEESLLPSLQHLKQAGALLAIDDFGTGYSALSYLSQFPIDCVKIDKSFIAGLSGPADAYHVLRTVLQLAETLGMTTIVEGIEDAAMAGIVATAGCQSAQGYWWSRPVAAAQVLPTVNRLANEGRRAKLVPATTRGRRRATADPSVVARALQLATAGASAHTIAAILNKEGVRTPSGRRWLAASVGALLVPVPPPAPPAGAAGNALATRR